MNKDSILLLIKKMSRPSGAKGIIDLLGIPTSERPQVRKLLKKMLNDGELIRYRNGQYDLPTNRKLITGEISFNKAGFAFVLTNDQSKDIFIPPKKTNGSMNGDTVECILVGRRKGASPEGKVQRVIERAHKKITGIYQQSKKYGFLIPDDRSILYDVFIPDGASQSAKDGQIVVAEIFKYPTCESSPEGKVIEIIGVPGAPGVDVELIIRKHNIPSTFPIQVTRDARDIADRVPEQEISERLDLREKTVFTIDGEHAKDFDDAVSIELLKGNIFRLGVHIADVSHYVGTNSYLDKEAFKRGNSVYFPEKVIPMLPFKLSNGICSLKQGVDRLTLSVFNDIGADGKILNTEFYKSVINSRERMTYKDVHRIVENKAPWLQKKYAHILDDLLHMQKLAAILTQERREAGSIDFDLPEPELILDSLGNPENVLRVYRNSAHMIIEEFMLLANKTVAKALSLKGIPSVYRVHKEPDPSKINDFFDFANNFGYSIQTKPLKPVIFKNLLDELEGKSEERVISSVLLRHMERAYYCEENLGHFGLAFDTYTHFTSPIRRYPDLLVHRFFKELLVQRSESHKDQNIFKAPKLQDMLKHCSDSERRAETAERELVNLKKAQIMLKKIGEEFSGVISGITSFGVFVELDEIFVEGLIHVSSLNDDYYIFNEKSHTLTGEHLKIKYQLGMKVLIRVHDVSIARREIDFRLIKRL